MTREIILTEAQKKLIKELRGQPGPRRPVTGPRIISQKTGISERAIRRFLGIATACSGELTPKGAFFHCVLPQEPPPEHILIDRDRRINEERSLSAVVFGDPEPSRSALGKRNETGQETQDWQAGTQWEIAARAWHRPKRSSGPIKASDGGRLLAKLAQGNPYREAP